MHILGDTHLYNSDRLNSVDPKRVSQLIMRLVDRSQEAQKELQIAAIGCYFLAMCQTLKLKPQDILMTAANILDAPASYYSKELSAAKDYVHGEFL